MPSEVDEGELLGEGAEKKSVEPVSFNGACAARISEHHGWDLIKQSRIAYADPGQNLTVTCSVSKEYPHPTGTGYWFAFHTHHLEKLREAGSGYAAFGCGSPDQIALFPIDFLESQLDGLNQTHRADGRSYWHDLIHCNEGKWCLKDKRVQGWTDISTRMVFNRGKPA